MIRRFTSVGLLLVITTFTLAFDACRIDTPAGVIDLNGAKSSTGYYKIEDPTISIWNYFVQICDAVTNFPGNSVCQTAYANAKGYQIFSDDSDCFPMAAKGGDDITVKLQDPTQPNNGVTITYQELDYNNYIRSIEIDLNCDPTAPDNSPLNYVKETYTWGNSKYFFAGKSKYACPGAAGGNLPLGQYGVGGLLLTLFFAAIALYFIVGAIVLKFKFQKNGVELIPNVEFWKDVPLLIRDGGLFIVDGSKILIAKVTGKTGYQEMA
jgi:hypothetical protein